MQPILLQIMILYQKRQLKDKKNVNWEYFIVRSKASYTAFSLI